MPRFRSGRVGSPLPTVFHECRSRPKTPLVVAPTSVEFRGRRWYIISGLQLLEGWRIAPGFVPGEESPNSTGCDAA